MERGNPTHGLAERLFEQLVTSLESGDGAPLANYLCALHRFHRYTFRNVMLILSQRPDATKVADFHTWRSLGRCVRRGEKGIAILAPLVRKVKDAEGSPSDDATRTTRYTIYGWRTVYVFDIAQTDGNPLPEYAPPATTGDVGPFYGRLMDLLPRLGIALTLVNDLGGAEGQCRPGHGSIKLLDRLDPPTAFAVLVNELAHDLLHRRDDADCPTSRSVREMEAEAVAAIIAEAIGLQHLASARDYIRLYDGRPDTLKTSLTRIQQAATTILSGICDSGLAVAPEIQEPPRSKACNPVAAWSMARIPSRPPARRRSPGDGCVRFGPLAVNQIEQSVSRWIATRGCWSAIGCILDYRFGPRATSQRVDASATDSV